MKTLTEFSTLALRRAAAAKTANASLEGDALAEAMATALAVPVDRVPRLLEALDLVGDGIDRVRLVRVFQGEKAPTGAQSVGEFHYVIDRVAAAGKSQGRGNERGEGRGDRGGDRGDRGGNQGDRKPRGDRDKPRGLGALVAAANKEPKPQTDDDRPARGEMPRAGIGWQLTSAPREFKGKPRGPGGGGPKGPRDRKGPRPPRLGPDGQPLPAREPRGPRPPRNEAGGGGNRGERNDRPRGPRPDRKPVGPDANGNGPDGKPWDPERRAQRQAERANRAGAPAATPATEPKAE